MLVWVRGLGFGVLDISCIIPFMNTKDNESIRKIQKYIGRVNIERGFGDDTVADRMLLFTEEVGELARAIREVSGLKFSETTKRANLEEELADVQILLLGIAEMLEVDMYSSVQKKDSKNKKRNWISD